MESDLTKVPDPRRLTIKPSETGDPVGVAEQIGFLSNGAPFEYSISVHRYDQFSVEMMVKH